MSASAPPCLSPEQATAYHWLATASQTARLPRFFDYTDCEQTALTQQLLTGLTTPSRAVHALLLLGQPASLLAQLLPWLVRHQQRLKLQPLIISDVPDAVLLQRAGLPYEHWPSHAQWPDPASAQSYLQERLDHIQQKWAVSRWHEFLLPRPWSLVQRLLPQLTKPPVSFLTAKQQVARSLPADIITVADWFQQLLATTTQPATQRHYLVAAMRQLAPVAPRQALELFASWQPLLADQRAQQLAVTLYRQQGAVQQPLALLSQLPPNHQATAELARLTSTQRWANGDYLAALPPATARPQPLREPTQPSRIFYLAQQCLPYHTSGYATRTQGLVGHLQAAGVEVQVVARPGYPADTGHTGAVPATHTEQGLDYHFAVLPTGQGLQTPNYEQYAEAALAALSPLAEKFRPTHIQAGSNYTNGYLGLALARQQQVPFIYEMRGLWHVSRAAKEPAYAATEHYAAAHAAELGLARAADHVFCITAALQQWLVAQGVPASRTSLLPNAVDFSQFMPGQPRRALQKKLGLENKIVIGYLGSFVDYEGLEQLVAALPKVRAAVGDSFRLLWVGDGPALAPLLAQAKALGVASLIRAVGRQPFARMRDYYNLIDLAVFPRRGLEVCELISPLKPFEVMAMQKALLVSNVAPLAEIVTHQQTGLIFEKDNISALARTLIRVLQRPAQLQQLGQAGYAWAKANRQWPQIAASALPLYARLR